MVSFRGALVASLLLTLGPTTLWAQGRQTAALTGTVSDDTGGVLPGVTVTINSPSLIGGPQVAVTDSEGRYRFPALAPGVYEIAAELQGFQIHQRAGIRLPLGETITVDFRLPVAALTETVTVVADSPLVDVTSSAASTNLDNEILQNLPTGRFQPAIINSAPGVSADVAFGGTESSNALLMDGVDVSDPEAGSPWSFFNYNWVQEVQIVSLGANAEYGEFTGVAANSIIRSGSNRFSGLGEYWTTRANWFGNNTKQLSEELQEQFKPREIVTLYDTSVQVGGPILRDKLWFFTGLQYYKREDRPAGFTGGLTSERDPRFIGKINWAVSPSVRVEGFFEADKYDITGRGAGPFRPAETVVDEPSPEINWNGRVTWTIDDRTLLDIRNGGYDGYFPLEPTPPQTREGPYPHYDLLTGMYSANTPYYGRFDRTPNTTAVTLTRYVDKFLGKSHEFKFGFEFQRSVVKNESGYPGGRLYLDYGGEPYLAYLWDGYVNTGTNKRTTFYAQDTWTLSDRLTINPGVRVSINRGSVPERGTVFSTNPVSPRIGFAWDLAADHKTVVRGHYGRFHDALLSGMYSFMDLSQSYPFITAEVLGENDFLELDRVEPSTNQGIDPNVTHSYVDQYIVGIERELFRDFSLQAQYIRRNFRNFIGFIDRDTIYEPVETIDPGPDGRLGTDDDGGPLTVYNATNPGEAYFLLTNPEGAYRDYNAVQLVGRKRWSDNWQLIASYTWSRAEGSVNNTFSSNAGGRDLGQTGVFANPNNAINRTGRASFDFTHDIKVDGTYRVPFWGGFNVSAVYRYRSGLPWGRTITVRDLDQGRETVRVEPRGTRRLGAINNIDLRAEKTFNLGTARRLGVFVDVFNLNNQGVHNSDIRTAVQELSGDNFGQPNRWIDARNFRAGIRFTF